MDTLVLDFRLALRRLARTPGFTLIAAFTLALGIGATTAIYSVVDAALFRALPYPAADELLRIYTPADDGGRSTVSPPDFVDYRSESHSFRALAAFINESMALSGEGPAEQRDGAYVTGDFFTVLGVRPALGRPIGADDAVPDGPRVVMLSDGLWRGRFGGDLSLVGRTIMLNGVATTVIGVMPPQFDYPAGADLWRPLRFTAQELATQRGAHYLGVIGRLRPGVSVAEANADLATIQARLAVAYPKTDNAGPAPVRTLRDSLVGDMRTALYLLLGAVGLVLLVACANVANLLLARALRRQREFTVRTALGASRARVMRELLVESVVLALIGGAGGVLLAVWGTKALLALHPGDQLLASVSVDGRVLAATFALSTLCGLLFGLVPALHVAPRGDVTAALAGGGRGGSASASAQRAKRALAIAEMALSVVLLTGAGLLLRSLLLLNAVDPGFVARERLAFSVSLPDVRYDTPEKSAAFMTELLSRLRALADVRDAAVVSGLPLTGYSYSISAHALDGRVLENAESDRLSTQIRIVSPDYFRTMGIPVKLGRAITDADRHGAPPVVVMNEAAARLVFPGASPLGHEFIIGTSFGLERGRAGGEVVGVVGDTHDAELDRDAVPTIYLAHDQFPVSSVSVVMHARSAPASLVTPARSVLAALDPDVPLFEPRTMTDVVAASLNQQRFIAMLLGIFAAIAALLAGVGLYGVIAYSVGERTREIGIRVALGAVRGDVLRLVLRGGMALAAIGVLIGLAGSVATTRLLGGLLYGVGPLDLTTLVLTTLLVFAAALLATVIPAHRAARLDPVEALREE
jgi:predicted permease